MFLNLIPSWIFQEFSVQKISSVVVLFPSGRSKMGWCHSQLAEGKIKFEMAECMSKYFFLCLKSIWKQWGDLQTHFGDNTISSLLDRPMLILDIIYFLNSGLQIPITIFFVLKVVHSNL
jgi:hypothetical protein